MEKELDENLTTDSDSGGSKRKSYPVRELKYIIDFVGKIYNELGVNLFHSREDIAELHGLEVTSIKQVLSTAQQYGLLDLKHGTGYKVSPLFIRIHKPLNDAEKTLSIVESLRNSEVISKLLDDYNGHSVPSLHGITNNVERSFGFKESIAQRVAEIFGKNLNDFNLINSQNQLALSNGEKPKVQENTPPPKPPSKDENLNADENLVIITIPLRGKKAFLHLPNDYTDIDLKRVSRFVDALKDDNEGG